MQKSCIVELYRKVPLQDPRLQWLSPVEAEDRTLVTAWLSTWCVLAQRAVYVKLWQRPHCLHFLWYHKMLGKFLKVQTVLESVWMKWRGDGVVSCLGAFVPDSVLAPRQSPPNS